MTEITAAEANAIAEYKRRERLTRQEIANALLIDLKGLADMDALDTETQTGGNIEEARDFYLSQLGGKPEFTALIEALREIVAQKHALLWQAQQIERNFRVLRVWYLSKKYTRVDLLR